MEKNVDLFIVVFDPHQNDFELRKLLETYERMWLNEKTALIAAKPVPEIFNQLNEVRNVRDTLHVFSVTEHIEAHPENAKSHIQEWINERKNPSPFVVESPQNMVVVISKINDGLKELLDKYENTELAKATYFTKQRSDIFPQFKSKFPNEDKLYIFPVKIYKDGRPLSERKKVDKLIPVPDAELSMSP